MWGVACLTLILLRIHHVETNYIALIIAYSVSAQIFSLLVTDCVVDCVGVGRLDVPTRQAHPLP